MSEKVSYNNSYARLLAVCTEFFKKEKTGLSTVRLIMSKSNEISLSLHGKYLRIHPDNTIDLSKVRSIWNSLVAIFLPKATCNKQLEVLEDLNLGSTSEMWKSTAGYYFLFCKLIMGKIACVRNVNDFLIRIFVFL